MIYYAHTRKDLPEEKWQTLKEHLLDTAQIASDFTGNKEIAKFVKVAGLLHDLGKYQEEFQNYLKNGGKRGSVPHARWGALLADCLKQQEISFAVDGHHKGLPDESEWFNNDMSGGKMEEEEKEKLVKLFDLFLKDTGINQNELLFKSLIKEQLTPQEKELLTRYVYSCVVDADWLNTEKFMNKKITSARTQKTLQTDTMIKTMDKKFSEMKKEGKINILRNQARDEALKKAEKDTGFYTLNLPTGMGKTLTSFYWALKHAKKHDLKRIIIVLPYISIIDQTAKELKNLFGEYEILEHHSNLSIENEPKKGEQYNSKELATENWNYPIIVTTTVQFFESVFSNRASKCRKIHNLESAVVIFDEVQSLPKEVILPTLNMMKNINKLLNTTFMFCTATMPAFNKRKGFDGIEGMVNLINKPNWLFKKTIRVKFHEIDNMNPVSADKILANVADGNKSALVIYNTKKEVKSFYESAVERMCWEKIYHLSTYMCPNHRKVTIERIRNDLEKKKKILVVSTQLIEAGVDFDFPIVYRAMAPLESIIQSAGRCNREGTIDFGDVYIFEPEENKMPDKTYKTCANHTKLLISNDIEKLYKYNIFEKYYKNVLGLFVEADKFKIDGMRNEFNFQQVNDAYRIIDNATEALFIKDYNDTSKILMKDIEKKDFLSRDDFRKVQQYSVQVYPNMIKKNYRFIGQMQQGIKVWLGKYNSKTGIIEDGSFVF